MLPMPAAARPPCHHASMSDSRAPHAMLLIVLVIAGCASGPTAREWGASATVAPGWERVRASAANAIRDPWVWAPLVGAALFQIDDWDHDVSDWAQRETPIFGSQRAAEDWSDYLRDGAALTYVASVVVTPSGDGAETWLVNKAKGYAVGLAAIVATGSTTNALKSAADRERPDESERRSFPSGHSSRAAVSTRLASRNLEYLPLGPRSRLAANAGLNALTIGTGWARIEAGKHFPADTLVGTAIGNFFANFFNDAFLDPQRAGGTSVEFAPLPGGAELRVAVSF